MQQVAFFCLFSLSHLISFISNAYFSVVYNKFLLNQFEYNKTAPKLTTIIKIADALDVLPRDLIDKADLAELPEIKEVQGSKPRIRTSNIDYVKECLDSESVLNIIELTELFHENKDTLEIFWLLLRNFNLLNDTGKRLVMGYANDLTYRYKKDELDLIF